MTDYDLICDFQSLYEAHKNARRCKRHKADVITFEMDLANNLWELKKSLESKIYKVGEYSRFMIHDPKDREIQALKYSDRVVQHSLCDNVLTPFLEKRFIYDNCACRKGKGTHFGMDRLTGFLREYYKQNGVDGWILKADVRKFFPSINHNVLVERLHNVIPDKDVMNLLEEMQIKHYTRYMDDMVLLHKNKEYLQETLLQMQEMCNNRLKLELIENGVVTMSETN